MHALNKTVKEYKICIILFGGGAENRIYGPVYGIYMYR